MHDYEIATLAAALQDFSEETSDPMDRDVIGFRQKAAELHRSIEMALAERERKSTHSALVDQCRTLVGNRETVVVAEMVTATGATNEACEAAMASLGFCSRTRNHARVFERAGK